MGGRLVTSCENMHRVFFFNDTATTEIYTLSLHDALPIFVRLRRCAIPTRGHRYPCHEALAREVHLKSQSRSEEHTSELQSPCNLVCRLLLEKKRSPAIHSL